MVQNYVSWNLYNHVNHCKIEGLVEFPVIAVAGINHCHVVISHCQCVEMACVLDIVLAGSEIECKFTIDIYPHLAVG